MDVVSHFVSRYIKEYDFYDQAARLVKERLEANLKASGVRCMVTSRAKDVSRLEEKCRQRDRTKNYSSPEQIFEDIADLAGVRVALYFPAERSLVDNAIQGLFRLTEPVREFPNTNFSAGKRFTGYSATHYRVQLKDDDASESDSRYSIAKVEIQVASVLMHAWSEVEHDLVYKPFEGDLSIDEYAILDQLNGMVIAGEIALETLQRAGERRVAESGRPFQNHYELAAHLINHVNHLSSQPINEAGLGRVDRLFTFMRQLKIETPASLAPHLEALHGQLEIRPIADQVIDSIVAEDPSRYSIYRAIVDELGGYGPLVESGDNDIHRQLGLFMDRWSRLETLVRDLTATTTSARFRPLRQVIGELSFLDEVTRSEVDQLRDLRNAVMHTRDIPSAAYLAAATEAIERIIDRIEKASALRP